MFERRLCSVFGLERLSDGLSKKRRTRLVFMLNLSREKDVIEPFVVSREHAVNKFENQYARIHSYPAHSTSVSLLYCRVLFCRTVLRGAVQELFWRSPAAYRTPPLHCGTLEELIRKLDPRIRD